MDDTIWVETHTRRKRDQPGGPAPTKTPCGLQLTDDNILGEWLPTKEDPEKENNMGTRGGGREGRGTQREGKVEMVFSLSKCLSKLTTYCVVV